MVEQRHVEELAQALGAEIRETHISWVLLTETDVYKLKKPVSFGFLDFTTLGKRREAAEAEVTLNRRLSPDVYLGVEAVRLGPARIGGDVSTAEDVVVHMRRLADSGRLDVMVDEDRITDAHLVKLAKTLADFHENARCDDETSRFGTAEAIAFNVNENFEQTIESRHDILSDEEAYELEQWQRGFRATHTALFDARIAAQRVRDGHGDLRLDQMYVDSDGGLRILDCIEFNDRFRYADVASDIAFLSMDMVFHGRNDLAERFLAYYARESQDYDLYSVVDFYEGYRAYVRGKIASFQGLSANTEAAREEAHALARRYYLLALATGREPLVAPRVIAVGGVIAAGKSTIASALAAQTGAAVVDTDRTRKHLMGVKATQPLRGASWSGAYDASVTADVYDEVIRRARIVLDSGRPVIVEASFRTAEHRHRVRSLADDLGLPLLFVECRAPESVLRERLQRRAERDTVSDGRVEILDDFLAAYEPPEELGDDELLVLDTTEPLEQSLTRVRALV